MRSFKLNPALADYLERNQSDATQSHSSSASREPQSYVSIAKRRHISVRLSEADISDIVASFQGGTAKHVLAVRYGVGLTTVKKVLRERGVKGQTGKWSRNKERTG